MEKSFSVDNQTDLSFMGIAVNANKTEASNQINIPV